MHQNKQKVKASERIHITVDAETMEMLKERSYLAGWSISMYTAHVLRQWYVQQLVQMAVNEVRAKYEAADGLPF